MDQSLLLEDEVVPNVQADRVRRKNMKAGLFALGVVCAGCIAVSVVSAWRMDVSSVEVDQALLDLSDSSTADAKFDVAGQWNADGINLYQLSEPACTFYSKNEASNDDWKVLGEFTGDLIIKGSGFSYSSALNTNIDELRALMTSSNNISLKAECSALATVHLLHFLPVSTRVTREFDLPTSADKSSIVRGFSMYPHGQTDSLDFSKGLNFTNLSGAWKDLLLPFSNKTAVDMSFLLAGLDASDLPMKVRKFSVKVPGIKYDVNTLSKDAISWEISTRPLTVELLEANAKFTPVLDIQTVGALESEQIPTLMEGLQAAWQHAREGRVDIIAKSVDADLVTRLLGDQHYISGEALPSITMEEAEAFSRHTPPSQTASSKEETGARHLLQADKADGASWVEMVSPPHPDLPADAVSIDCLRVDADSVMKAEVCGRMDPQFIKFFMNVDVDRNLFYKIHGNMKWTAPEKEAFAASMDLKADMPEGLSFEMNGALSEDFRNCSITAEIREGSVIPVATGHMFTNWRYPEDVSAAEFTTRVYVHEGFNDDNTFQMLLNGNYENQKWNMDSTIDIDFGEATALALDGRGTYGGDTWEDIRGTVDELRLDVGQEYIGGMDATMALKWKEEFSGDFRVFSAKRPPAAKDPEFSLSASGNWDFESPSELWHMSLQNVRTRIHSSREEETYDEWGFPTTTLIESFQDTSMNVDMSYDNQQTNAGETRPATFTQDVSLHSYEGDVPTELLFFTMHEKWLPFDWLPWIWEEGQDYYPEGLYVVHEEIRTPYMHLKQNVSLDFADQKYDLTVLELINSEEESDLVETFKLGAHGTYAGSWSNFEMLMPRSYMHVNGTKIGSMDMNMTFMTPTDTAEGAMTMGMEAMNEEQPDVAVMDMSMACAWNDVKVPSSDKTDAGDTIYLHKHMYARINKMQVHMNGEHIVNELPVGLEFLEEDWYPEMKREFYNFSPGRLKAYVGMSSPELQLLNWTNSLIWNTDNHAGTIMYNSFLTQNFPQEDESESEDPEPVGRRILQAEPNTMEIAEVEEGVAFFAFIPFLVNTTGTLRYEDGEYQMQMTLKIDNPDGDQSEVAEYSSEGKYTGTDWNDMTVTVNEASLRNLVEENFVAFMTGDMMYKYDVDSLSEFEMSMKLHDGERNEIFFIKDQVLYEWSDEHMEMDNHVYYEVWEEPIFEQVTNASLSTDTMTMDYMQKSLQVSYNEWTQQDETRFSEILLMHQKMEWDLQENEAADSVVGLLKESIDMYLNDRNTHVKIDSFWGEVLSLGSFGDNEGTGPLMPRVEVKTVSASTQGEVGTSFKYDASTLFRTTEDNVALKFSVSPYLSPNGLDIDMSTGVISGEPLDEFEETYKVCAVDGVTRVCSKLTITVVEENTSVSPISSAPLSQDATSIISVIGVTTMAILMRNA